MIDALLEFDQSVFLFFNSLHCNFFDTFMSLFSGKFIWIPLYASILLAMLRQFPPLKVLLFTVGIALSIVLADQMCASIIRPIFERLRPSNPDNPLSALTHIVNGYRGGAYGFPSCHAANSFSLAVITTLMFRKKAYTVLILSWALINSYSRLYLGVHYPGDLLVGAIVGSTGAVICYCITKSLLIRVNTRVADTPTCPALSRGIMKYFTPAYIAACTLLYIIICATAKTV